MISTIEKMLYEETKKLKVEDEMEIKNHKCLFVDLGEDLGFSVLVFRNQKQIFYANEYEFNHVQFMTKNGKVKLKQRYVEILQRKLYTDAELLEKIKSYEEYQKKNHFLRNYWIMKHDYVTSFVIGDNEKKELEKRKEEFPFYNPISFCYVKDKSIICEQNKYLKHLQKEYESLKENSDTFRKMIRQELYNHEACITGDYEDALHALGLKFSLLSEEKKKIVKEEINKLFP